MGERGVVVGDTAESRPRSLPRRLVAGGLIAGLWAIAPPLVGPQLLTARSVEIVDHVVPGVVVLVVVVGLVVRRSASELVLFAGGLVVTLAGVWMVGTHVPLVAQAVGGQAGVAATVHHSLPPLATLALGVGWTWHYR